MTQTVVRCIWRLLLPLLDLGYQVDVRIMNAVHYGVPQQRRVSCLPSWQVLSTIAERQGQTGRGAHATAA